MAPTAPADGEWASTLDSPRHDFASDTASTMSGRPPRHPLPAMQGAFEESMVETMQEMEEPEINQYARTNSVYRRKLLLEQETYERTVAGRWKQKPGEKFHPLVKLVAQISFGMHLLHQGLAKSDDEVIRILQTHVDEVDGFLERTTEDFDLAQEDIDDRLRYLRVPLEHGEVFDTMLNDRGFRTAIVEGNEKIEHIVDRTAAAMRDALKDIQKGLDSTKELARYLSRLDNSWPARSPEHAAVYAAMLGNTEGWGGAFVVLQQKGSMLSQALVELEQIIADLQRWAGIASRRNLVSQSNMSQYTVDLPSRGSSRRHSMSPPQSPNKGLPREPKSPIESKRNSRPRSFEHYSSTRDEREGEISRGSPKEMSKSKSKRPVQDISTTKSGTVAHPEVATAPMRSIRAISPPDSSNHGSNIARRASLTDRTRLITRKLSPNHDEDADVLAPLPVLDPRTEKFTPRSAGIGNSRLSDSRGHLSPEHDSSFGDYGQPESAKSTYPLSGSPPKSPSIDYHNALLATTSLPEGHVNLSHPLLKDIRAREIRFASTAPGSPFKPVLKDLPLRHFRSQESLSTVNEGKSEQPNGENITDEKLRRSSSVQTTSTTAGGSSVYSSEIKSSGETSGPVSSVYPSVPATSNFLQSGLTRSSSVYSPESLNSSQYSKSLFDTLSPPPDESSAAPSPLRFPQKSVGEGPKTAPLEVTRPIHPPSPPAESPRPVTPLANLTSATVTGPEPDLYPYIPSPTPSPRSYKHPPMDFPEETESAKIPPNTETKYYRQIQPDHAPSHHASGWSPLALKNSAEDEQELTSPDRDQKSPWKKVFGNVGFGSSSKGGGSHRKSKSEKLDLSGLGIKEEKTEADGGRLAGRSGSMGRKGDAWISRKNFLKT